VSELGGVEGAKIDYSVRLLSPLGFASIDALGQAGYRFELAIDIDPTDMVNFVAYDPFTFYLRGGAGDIQSDHDFLTSAETEVRRTSSATYAADMAIATGAQNSMQPFFGFAENPSAMRTFLTANGSTDPAATGFAVGQPIVFPDGRYEVYLLLVDMNGVVQARTTTSSFMSPTNSAAGTSTPATLLAALMPTE
jgi:hypothetical protein